MGPVLFTVSLAPPTVLRDESPESEDPQLILSRC